MAYQTTDVLKIMEEECESRMTSLRVDGGACANNLLMQFQSDILNIPILRPSLIETTACGAANLAALTVGIYSSMDEIRKASSIEKAFTPCMSEEERTQKLRMWHRAVKKSTDWAE